MSAFWTAFAAALIAVSAADEKARDALLDLGHVAEKHVAVADLFDHDLLEFPRVLLARDDQRWDVELSRLRCDADRPADRDSSVRCRQGRYDVPNGERPGRELLRVEPHAERPPRRPEHANVLNTGHAKE